jgi:hAT family C-terminal dimerisation region
MNLAGMDHDTFEKEVRMYHLYRLEEWRTKYSKEQTSRSWMLKDPLEDWRSLQSLFPKLALLAENVLAIPAAAASAERVFSGLNRVVTAERSSMNKELAGKIVVCYLRHNRVHKKQNQNFAFPPFGICELDEVENWEEEYDSDYDDEGDSEISESDYDVESDSSSLPDSDFAVDDANSAVEGELIHLDVFRAPLSTSSTPQNPTQQQRSTSTPQNPAQQQRSTSTPQNPAEQQEKVPSVIVLPATTNLVVEMSRTSTISSTATETLDGVQRDLGGSTRKRKPSSKVVSAIERAGGKVVGKKAKT